MIRFDDISKSPKHGVGVSPTIRRRGWAVVVKLPKRIISVARSWSNYLIIVVSVRWWTRKQIGTLSLGLVKSLNILGRPIVIVAACLFVR